MGVNFRLMKIFKYLWDWVRWRYLCFHSVICLGFFFVGGGGGDHDTRTGFELDHKANKMELMAVISFFSFLFWGAGFVSKGAITHRQSKGGN